MTYTEAHRLYWLESAEDEARNQAERERREQAAQIADQTEEQHPSIYDGATIPTYIAIRAALEAAALAALDDAA